MAAFAGENMVTHAVPIHSGFAQSSAHGDHGLIANRLSLDLVERDYIFSFEGRNTPGVGFEVVDEELLF